MNIVTGNFRTVNFEIKTLLNASRILSEWQFKGKLGFSVYMKWGGVA